MAPEILLSGRQSSLFHRRRTHCFTRYTGTSRSLQPARKALQLSAVSVHAAQTHYAANASRLHQAHFRHLSSSGSIKALPRRQFTKCDAQSSAAAEVAPRSGLGTVRQFLIGQFLPVGLLLAMLLGFLCPSPGIKAADAGLQTLTTTGIFIISGLNLKRGEATQALTAWRSILYGLATILLITPLAGFLALRLPLNPPELAFGLTVFCCMPTTLSSAVSLTQTVGGNTALALLLTVSSNLLGIFTMPFILCQLLGASGSAVTMKPGPLLANLLKTILAPLLAGATIRSCVPAVAKLVDSNKKRMSLLSSMLLILVPWMQISKAVMSGVAISVTSLLGVLAAGVGIHLVFLAFNLTATAALQLGKTADNAGTGIRRACILVGSQKTLPIAVTVLHGLAPQIGGAVGLAVIPCVVSHLVQIVIDSMLVSLWLKQDTGKLQATQQLA
ncbi:TPA: hypothetical protein ACH3X3_012432 [Trebouxia sp. C0006]